ncbi:T9SS type A sorting domain-containing protein [Candidatus Marinimicrobia bacterium]|nr:T9SS type A sorting domain-containing protein [Candidatus Neomarinimicrobiota bacterium]
MIRILVLTILSFSFLIASNSVGRNGGEIVKGSQTSTFSINKLDAPPDVKLSKSKSKEKSLAVKARSSALKKAMDTKINIAKKLVSEKSKKTDQNRSSYSLEANSNFDPHNFNLKMKKKSARNSQSVAPDFKRNILNTETAARHKIYPELSDKASDPIIAAEVRTRMQSTLNRSTNLALENTRGFYSQEQIDAINIGITGSNLLQNQSREDVWLNTQQVQYDYNSGENENLINRYFNENNQLLESVEWFWDNGEWFLGSRLAYYYHEDGTLDYYTFGFRLDENGFFIEDYYYMHFYNADGSLSHMDIFYHGNGNPELIYGYTYVFSEDDEGIVTDILELRHGWGVSEGELNGSPSMMETYTYDENSDLVLKLRQYDYDFDNIWENNSQILYTYGTDGLASELVQYYDYETWVDNYKYDYAYDENGNMESRLESYESYYQADLTPQSIRMYLWEIFETEEEIEGQEFGFQTVADLYANFGGILNSYGANCLDCSSISINDVGSPATVTAFDEESFTNYVNAFEFQYFYFQWMDANGNEQYDPEETYVVSCEFSVSGFPDHSVSYSGDVFEMNFNRFWWLAYDFVFYGYGEPEEDVFIWGGYDFPFGWQMFSWGDAQLDTTIADGYSDGYYGYPTSALTYVQGGQWSGAGLDIAPPIDLHFHADHSSLKFWMWSEQDAPMLRMQFEDGVDRVGYNFVPEPMEGWHEYDLPLSDFVFFDGSQAFDWNQTTILQVMGEGNGEAGRMFHFSGMMISETQNDQEELYFDFIGDLNGHYYYVSQEPMSWHDGLNFTDTVNADGFVHMATINSEEENVFLENTLQSFGPVSEWVWLGLTDEFEEGNWQWVTGEPVEYTSWAEGEPNNSGGVEHYADFNINSGDWNDAPHDVSNLVLLEFIPNNPPEGPSIEGTWEMGPFAGSLRVGPEPFSGDWWSISDQDVQTRACYFDDLYVFDEEGFHNDQGEETWLEWWQGMDPEGCGAPVYPHDGSSNPAGYVFDEAAGTLTLNGVGSYMGLPKAVNGAELTSPDQAPESITYQVYMQGNPRMMTLVINVSSDENSPIFWTFDLVPAMDAQPVYFIKEDYADVTNPDNWDHVTPSLAIMRGDNQGLYNPYVEDSYNGSGPSGTLWSLGPTSEADPMGYMEWIDAIGGQAANLPGQTLSMWVLGEDLYFDIEFENWTSGNNGGGFSYWRTVSEPPEGPNVNVHFVWGLMGSDETGDGSLENPYETIGHAVNIMENDDMVAVGPGNYNENILVTDKSGMLVSFSGSDSTFINGNGGQIMSSQNGFWMIDGFTFTNGSAVDGGAVLSVNGGLMVGRSIFAGNNAENNGGAVAAIHSNVFMDSVMFIQNNANNDGAALFIENSVQNLDGQWFVALGNTMMAQNNSGSQGAGLYIRAIDEGNTFADLFNINVRNNFAVTESGVRLNGNVQANFYECYFVGNQAADYAAAGGFGGGSNVILDRCVIADNQANLGNSGGFSVWNGSNANFYSCTFTNNSAEYGSALTVGGGSYASVDASIVWNNPGDNALASVQWDENGSQLDVFHSVVQGGESGIYSDDLSYVYQDGVIDIDPLFCDPENGDFSIDMNSGAITPWGEPMGALGYGCEGTIMASAAIVSIEDVPNDQGGRVYLTFEKSLFDTDGLGRTEMYTVERMDGNQWVGLTSVGAYASEVYVVEVTTLADSTSEGDAMTTYRVVANMDEGNFESEPASGYSVDNIAPMMIAGLVANVADGVVMLSWEHSEANDFSHYMIYYSTVADFIPSEETMIGTHSLPSFEHNVEEMGDHYYVVSAVDMNENESEYPEAVNVTLLSLVEVHGLPETFAIHQNYPNPFNPNTTIRFDLPEASHVSLAIYDMMGREVTSLVNNQIDAGYHLIQWDGTNNIGSSVAAGVYIYIFQVGNHRDVNKMIYLK